MQRALVMPLGACSGVLSVVSTCQCVAFSAPCTLQDFVHSIAWLSAAAGEQQWMGGDFRLTFAVLQAQALLRPRFADGRVPLLRALHTTRPTAPVLFHFCTRCKQAQPVGRGSAAHKVFDSQEEHLRAV